MCCGSGKCFRKSSTKPKQSFFIVNVKQFSEDDIAPKMYFGKHAWPLEHPCIRPFINLNYFVENQQTRKYKIAKRIYALNETFSDFKSLVQKTH